MQQWPVLLFNIFKIFYFLDKQMNKIINLTFVLVIIDTKYEYYVKFKR